MLKITFIRYAQNQKIRKSNKSKGLGTGKPKDLNKIAKIG
jgi:hypothetical protein